MKPWGLPDPKHLGSEEIVGPGGLKPVANAAEQAMLRVKLARILMPDCESPIEVILGVYLVIELEHFEIDLAPQYNWLNFRIDWALVTRDRRPLVFVECDGKAFHSTPEQLANDHRKDTAAARAGIPLFRFSGSEIWRNPEACAQIIVSEAQRR